MAWFLNLRAVIEYNLLWTFAIPSSRSAFSSGFRSPQSEGNAVGTWDALYVL